MNKLIGFWKWYGFHFVKHFECVLHADSGNCTANKIVDFADGPTRYALVFMHVSTDCEVLENYDSRDFLPPSLADR